MALVLSGALCGCAVGPQYRAPAVAAPSRFQSEPPAGAEAADTDLNAWWAQFDDPLVARLVHAAVLDNPTLAQARARVAQARAQLGGSQGALLPAIDANGSVIRSKALAAPGATTIGTATTRSLDASWELDLFGGLRKGAEAADARLAARIADWHGARVSLGAEVATTLLGLRACEATSALLAEDLRSRQQTGQLTGLKIRAGLTATGDAVLSEASIADGRQRLQAQQLECELTIQALVELTGIDTDRLRPLLAQSAGLPRPRGIEVRQVPAEAVAQRPDIAAGERDLAAAAAEINVAEANRYPRLTLTGSIGQTGLRSGGSSATTGNWSFGPSLSLPLFDGGRRRAAVDAAMARYQEAEALYRQRVRGAVRDIEQALLRLDSFARRETDAAAAARDYERYFQTREEKFKAGNGSLFELEDARRSMLSARQTLIGVQRERVDAWIALYKALGGGLRQTGDAA